MDFVKAVYGCRELSAAVLRLVTPEVLQIINKETSGGACQLQLPCDNEVSSGVAHVTTLVLQDVECADYPFLTEPTDAGAEALRAMQRALFGSDSGRQSLMQSVYCGSVVQAQCTLKLCAATLVDSLAPHNCLSIYGIATSCNCAPLEAAARAFALRHFSAAAQLDYAGITMLPACSLMAFLCSDALQVSHELEVFSALVAWVERDPEARMPGFARHLAAAVRLSMLSMEDLLFIDDHPLVRRDITAMQLVALVYLSKLTGTACDRPFGLYTCSRPRRAQEPAAAAEYHSVLSKLVRSLAARGKAAAAAPGMPGEVAADVGVAKEPLAGAPTPAGRAPSQSPRQQPLRPPAHRALDLLGVGTASHGKQPVACRTLQFCSAAYAPSAPTSPSQQGQLPTSAPAAPSDKSPAQPQAAGVNASALPAGGARLSRLELEAMLSPNKPGIRGWLDSATAAPPSDLWPMASKRQLQFA